MFEQFRQQERDGAMLAMIPDWMSQAGRHMMNMDGLQPVKWAQFSNVVRLSDDREFGIV
jgi:hypothetical protein